MSVSIRSRLLLLVLLVMLPCGAAALWVIVKTYNDERVALERNLRSTSRALSAAVDRELIQRSSIAHVLSLTRSMQLAPDIPASELELFRDQARRAMEGLGGWVELSAGTRTLLDTRLDVQPPSALAGAPLMAAMAEMPTVSPLREERPRDGLRSAVVYPVKVDGRTVLNLAVTILPRELQRMIDQQELPDDWVTSVVDSQGVVVARHPGGAPYAGRSVSGELKAKLQGQREAMFRSVSLDGVPVIGYFTTSSQGWSVITAMPRPNIVSFPEAVLRVTVGALLMLGVALAGSVWMARRIAKPVISLKQAAQRMQAGQAVGRSSTGIAECDDVLRALASASESAQEARAYLETQVTAAVKRTREAEQRAANNQGVEALGRLTGGVAHDFNNLLGVIGNSAYLIQRHATQAELVAPVEATLRAVETGSRLTQQLLRFAGRQPMRPQAIDLSAFLEEAKELINTVVGRRVKLATVTAPGTRRVVVDPGELQLALINLALNARDAMPSGGPMWLRAHNASPDETEGLPPGRYVLIAVSDEGTGIDESVIERVFDPFFTTKPMGKGTGLGLSQVRGFCAQAGGTARIASTPGIGTVVSLLLPAQGEVTMATPAQSPGGDGEDLSERHVLLVEDNDELAEVTMALLESYGSRVQRCRSAEEALTELQSIYAQPAAPQNRFDVVLSDIAMPGAMDGVGLALTVRERWSDLPVVLISGYSAAMERARDFIVLRKPCTPEDLVSALRRAMNLPVGK